MSILKEYSPHVTTEHYRDEQGEEKHRYSVIVLVPKGTMVKYKRMLSRRADYGLIYKFDFSKTRGGWWRRPENEMRIGVNGSEMNNMEMVHFHLYEDAKYLFVNDHEEEDDHDHDHEHEHLHNPDYGRAKGHRGTVTFPARDDDGD